MIDAKPMKLIKFCITLLLAFVTVNVLSQDLMPETLRPQTPLNFDIDNPWFFQILNPIKLISTDVYKFKGREENVICDKEGSLNPFYKKLYDLMSNKKGTVRIVHIGDSHVRGHFFPGIVKTNMEKVFGSSRLEEHKAVFDYSCPGVAPENGLPGVAYQVYGINGATAQKFCNPEIIDEISRLKPDLIVISFGTNESYTRRYNAAQVKNQYDQLIRMLRKSCPNTVFLLTTPPGCYLKYRGRFSYNENSSKVSDLIVGYAEENGLAYWDLFNIVGGRDFACKNWMENKLMQKDRIHFTRTGYEYMGALLYNAIIKSLNDYAGN